MYDIPAVYLFYLIKSGKGYQIECGKTNDTYYLILYHMGYKMHIKYSHTYNFVALLRGAVSAMNTSSLL